MIGRLIDELIEMRARMFAIHPPIISSGNDVPQVTDDGIDKEKLPMIVPVCPPRIGSSFSDNFESMRHWVETPYTCIQRRSLFGRGAGRAHVAHTLNPVTPVKPSIRT